MVTTLLQEVIPDSPAEGEFVRFPDSPFELFLPYPPAGDQPEAIRLLCEGVEDGLMYQTLLGAWPTDLAPEAEIDREAMQRFGARVDGAMMKAMREARLRTNWSLPDLDYEKQVSAYLAAALELSPSNRFLRSFRHFEARLAGWGAQNGLIVTLLKLTVPGVPDIYQGAEFWEQSLVDPDNRRPVDFTVRQRALTADGQLDELIGGWRDGRLKQQMIATVLALRASQPELFAQGSYEPLEFADDSICGFRRRHCEEEVVVVLRRFPWRSAAQRLPRLKRAASHRSG